MSMGWTETVPTTAIVVGSGPNGLAAAVHLARSGVEVQVLEANSTIGGGARSGEQTVPGLIHDHCSAFHPMGFGSPVWTEFGLERHGLEWRWPEIDCAHPLDDGSAGLLHRSFEDTIDGLGIDGPRWRRLLSDLVSGYDDLADDLLGPVLSIPRHPLRLAAFGPRAVLPITVLGKLFRTEQARALYGGVAAHLYDRWDRPLTGSLGLMILAAGHRFGWPVAHGGSGSITTALEQALLAHSGTVTTDHLVTSRSDIPDADIVLLDTSAATALDIYGDDMPSRIAQSFRRYRTGAAAYKVDLAIDGDIPWTNPDCGRAGTVHVSGTFEETRRAEAQVAADHMPERPFLLVGQQYLADPIRSSGTLNPIYAYAHVPNGHRGDATDTILAQIERFAPGFSSRIVELAVTTPADLERHNPNFRGGDILGGANNGLQVVFRPRIARDPYSLGIDGVYLCSQSTPPGAGIHGICGYNAAASALRHLRAR